MLIAVMICGNGEVAELGLMRCTANALREKSLRGFKSLSLRGAMPLPSRGGTVFTKMANFIISVIRMDKLTEQEYTGYYDSENNFSTIGVVD